MHYITQGQDVRVIQNEKLNQVTGSLISG